MRPCSGPASSSQSRRPTVAPHPYVHVSSLRGVHDYSYARKNGGRPARESPAASPSLLNRNYQGGCLTSQALADGFQDCVVLDVVGVVGLELGGDAVERSLEGLLGRGVHHLGLEGAVSGEGTRRRAREMMVHGEAVLTWMPASSGDQARMVILFLVGRESGVC